MWDEQFSKRILENKGENKKNFAEHRFVEQLQHLVEFTFDHSQNLLELGRENNIRKNMNRGTKKAFSEVIRWSNCATTPASL